MDGVLVKHPILVWQARCKIGLQISELHDIVMYAV